MSNGFESPNYTQVPNDLFDVMLPEMGYAELKVVMFLCRKTFGFHRREYRVSIRKLAKGTGLTARNAFAGAEQAIKRGIVEKVSDGGVTLWQVVVKGTSVVAGDTGVVVGDTPSIKETTRKKTTLSTKTVESQRGGASRKQKRQQTSIDGETVTEPEVGSSPPPISALPPPPTEPAVKVTRDQVEDLLIEFCSETGIPMPEWEQKGKGAENQKRWLTPLRSLLKLCKADGKMASQLVKDAVKKMREDELTISAPQSIENVAIAIYGVKHGAKKRRTIGW